MTRRPQPEHVPAQDLDDAEDLGDEFDVDQPVPIACQWGMPVTSGSAPVPVTATRGTRLAPIPITSAVTVTEVSTRRARFNAQAPG